MTIFKLVDTNNGEAAKYTFNKCVLLKGYVGTYLNVVDAFTNDWVLETSTIRDVFTSQDKNGVKDIIFKTSNSFYHFQALGYGYEPRFKITWSKNKEEVTL